MATKRQEEFLLEMKETTKEFLIQVASFLEQEDKQSLHFIDDDEDKVPIFYSETKEEKAFVLSALLNAVLGEMTDSINIKMLTVANLMAQITYTHTDNEASVDAQFTIAQLFLSKAMKTFHGDNSEDVNLEDGYDIADSSDQVDSFDDLPAEDDSDDQSKEAAAELLKDQIAFVSTNLGVKIDYTEELEYPISMDVADFDKVAPYLRGVYVSFEAGNVIAMNENQFDTFYENLITKLKTSDEDLEALEAAEEPEAETIESDESKEEDD